MRWLVAAIVLLLVSCSKNIDRNFKESSSQKPETCTFGLREFNLIKRPFGQQSAEKRPTSSSTSSSSSVILLDFDGAVVSGTSWNYNGDIVCAPANLTDSQISEIIDRVTEDYRPFNVIVTTDQAVYDAGNPNKRMRVIITESWEWYGQAGGTSFIGSFTWGDNTPCFVFSTLLNYNQKNIAEAASHEVGHTLNLRHQSCYDTNCILLNEYNCGSGAGEIGWAPIMGSGYYQNITTWHNGPTLAGCTALQNDISIIAATLGFKNDDYPDSPIGASRLGASSTGMINNSSDVDFFSLSITSSSVISVVPFNVGSDAGADMDILLKVYDNAGRLLYTINDPLVVSASAVLEQGNYNISVEPAANIYAPVFGMMGKYTISVSSVL